MNLKTLKNLSLSREYFYFAIIVLTLAISSLLSLLWYSYVNLETEREERYILEASRIEDRLKDDFLYITSFAKFVGQQIVLSGKQDAESIASILNAKIDTHKIKDDVLPWTMFEFVNREGYAIASTAGITDSPKVDLERRPWIKTSRISPWSLQLTDPDIGIVSGEYVIPGGYGITDDQEKFLGIISIGFSINKLKKQIKNSLISQKTQFIILNKNYKVVMDSNNNNKNIDLLIEDIKNQDVFSNNDQNLLHDVAQGDIIYKAYKIMSPYNYIIIVGESRKSIRQELELLVIPQIIKTLILSFSFLVLLYFFRIKIVNPMKLLSERAEMLSQGNLDIEMPKVNSTEAANLVKALEMVKKSFQREKFAQNQLYEINNRIKSINSELENKVKIRTADLEKALAAKTDFLNNMSHEIRTPIQGFTAISEGLVEHWNIFDESKKLTFATQVANSAKRLASLINNLLDLSKFSADKMILSFEDIDLNKSIEEIINECDALYLNKKAIKIIFHRCEDASVEADEGRIGQVLRNLCANAIKFSYDYSQIIISLIRTNEGLKFTIKDSGIGIPNSELNDIFDPFTQSSFTKTQAGGTGLGLSICKQIINTHQGEIWAENNIDGGSSFHFIIPIKQR